jgi:hypothetical protein
MILRAGKKQGQYKNKGKQLWKRLQNPRILWFLFTVGPKIWQIGKWLLEKFPEIFE